MNTVEERVAYVNAQVACMLAELASMHAANRSREQQGHSHAYGEDEFFDLTNRYCVSHNAVIAFLRGE